MEYQPALDISTLSFIKTQIEARLREDFIVPNEPEPSFDCPEFWYGMKLYEMVGDFLEYEEKLLDKHLSLIVGENDVQ